MNKKAYTFFYFAIGVLLFAIFSTTGFAQKTKPSASSNSSTKTKTETNSTTNADHIKKINQLCIKYDPYVRKFSYDEDTDILTWVNKDGDITCSGKLTALKVNVKENTSDYMVQFTCTDKSNCIDCNYGGPTNLSAITLNNKDAANQIVSNILSIQIDALVRSIKKSLGTTFNESSSSSINFEKSIDRINELTKQYDPYARFFSYNKSSKILKWVSSDGDVTCSANTSEIKAVVEPSGKDYYVTFKSKSGSKCIESNYTGATNESAITLTSKSAAEEIVAEFNKIASSKNTKTDSYSSVKIGKQEWMNKNLDVERFRNGDLIPEVKTDAAWVKAGEDHKPAWCYYKNDLSNGRKYGKLYNYYAVTDSRGLAPKGWHIPSKREWSKLIDFLGGEKVAGEKMKEVDSWFKEVNSSDNSLFNALPGGFRYSSGSCDYIGEKGSSYYCTTFWADDDISDTQGWYIYLSNGSETAGSSEVNKIDGLSVRCIKD